jgi:hypothetical protein
MNTIKYSVKHVKKLIVILSLITVPSFAAVISIKPSSSEVMIGSLFSADILVADLGANEIPGAFDLNLKYDPTILQFKEYSLTNELGSISDTLALDLSAGLTNQGEVNISSVSLLDNIENKPNTFKLAAVVFKAVSEGTSVLEFSNVTLGNYFGDAISTVVQNSSVQAVPEPSSMALFCMGIFSFAGVLLVRKKYKNC